MWTRYSLMVFAVLTGIVSAPVLAQQISFRQPVSLPILNGPVAMATGDFNGDGKTDLAIANGGSGSISILIGKGDSTFLAPVHYTVPSGCTVGSLITGDFNRDHKADLMTACATGTSLLVFLGRGDGTFAAPVVTALPLFAFTGNLLESTVYGLTVADFNGDGTPDAVLLMAPDFSNELTPSAYLLLGRGDGSFQAGVKINAGNSLAFAVAEGDFNGDGKPDLAILSGTPGGSSPQTLTIELGDGKGSFATGASFSWAGSILNLLVADLNGDGKPDIISDGLTASSASPPPSVLAVYLGKGDGTFQSPITATAGSGALPLVVGLADLRGNGKLDLIEGLVGVTADGGAGPASVQIREGNGNGTFQSPVALPLPAGTFPFALATADFNGDGRIDLAMTGIPESSFTSTNSNSFSTIAQVYAALPPGTLLTYVNATPSTTLTFANVNAASFLGGSVAQNSIVSAFGSQLAPAPVSNTIVPVPTTLGGISIDVRDALGVARLAPIFYVSPGQINYAIPDGTAAGTATITILGNANPFVTQQSIVPVAPGVFGASGFAVGNVITAIGGVQTATSPVGVDASGNVVPVPIALPPGAQVVLILYGTGIRNHANAVTATLGSTVVQAAFAGPTGQYAGEDQINIFLPQQLQGAGLITVTLTVDGQTTNPLKIQIQ